MVPFYIYYSMFGFQRVGDLAWAAGDSRARGFLLGGTAGRTTLNGEGLQHEDGHSHIQAALIPNCIAYDPAYAYELAVIIHDGMRRMLAEQEDVFYYLTVMNENYASRRCRTARRRGSSRDVPASREGGDDAQVQLMGSGTILREVLGGRRAARARTSACAPTCGASPRYTELRRDGMEAERWNRLHPARGRRASFVEESLGAPARSSPPPTTSARCRTRSGRGWTPVHRARHRRLRPQRLPRRCAGSSRSTATTSPSRRCRRSGERRGRGGRDRQLRHRPRGGGPMAEVKEVKVPDIGDFADVPVVEVLVAQGDEVAEDDPLVTLETDKATMDVPGAVRGRRGRGRCRRSATAIRN